MPSLPAALPKVYSPFSRSKPDAIRPPPVSLHTSGSPRTARRMSTTSSLTLGAPSPQAPSPVTPTQPSTLTTLTYQNDLIGNFWGGRSQGMPVPPGPSADPTRNPGEAANPRRKRRHASLDTFEVDDLKAPPEPKTLARSLFLYGFLFPVLWLAGMVLVFSPTKYDPDLERAQVNSAEEMQRHKAAHRAAEERWARRCMCASAVLLGIIVVVVLTMVLAMKGK
ncbi:hypothetical protein PYCCODRAFT_1434242 [Trametes coccinea BRFM310]|uniref:Transmembrane protein n=1 Tax=Trametes coccinea (strain BRFM310) TaxID=1353009 RepID=A0A1Y2IRW5_TRAC3|nr:hypothetical protein PYCCODRAFT_1434242 [Trametes coccinea BRFM310]